MNVEKEIKRAIINYTKEEKMYEKKIDRFMQKTHICQRMDLPKELYLCVCEWLTLSESLILTTTCKIYMEHYKYIWNIIQLRYFPKSIIPKNDYLAIRQNIVINKWHYQLNMYNVTSYETWMEIVNDDYIVQEKSQIIENLNPSELYYIWEIQEQEKTLKTIKELRSMSYNNSIEMIRNLIETFKFTSKRDITGELYYTIKPDLDMRMYGLNPENEKDRKQWEIGLKWLTGVYTERKDYNYDDDVYDYNTYNYYQDNDGSYFRCRKRPDWC